MERRTGASMSKPLTAMAAVRAAAVASTMAEVFMEVALLEGGLYLWGLRSLRCGNRLQRSTTASRRRRYVRQQSKDRVGTVGGADCSGFESAPAPNLAYPVPRGRLSDLPYRGRAAPP